MNSERITWEYCEELYVHTFNVKWNNFINHTIYPNSQVKNTECEHISIKGIEGKEVAQGVERLPGKNKALRSNSTSTQKKKRYSKNNE
jgi:hypothetical protein